MEGLTSTQKFLLVALADFADESNSCYPGQQRLAEMVGVNRRSVSRNLQVLEDEGLISRQERRRPDGYRSSDRFVLHLEISCPKSSRDKRSRDLDDSLMCTWRQSHVRQTTGQEPLEEPLVEPPVTPIVPTVEFDDFYEVYPRKVAKDAARRAWAKAVKRESPEVIVDGARRYASDPNLPEKKFIPHPSTWLNGGRWADEPLPARSRDLTPMERAAQTIAIGRAPLATELIGELE